MKCADFVLNENGIERQDQEKKGSIECSFPLTLYALLIIDERDWKRFVIEVMNRIDWRCLIAPKFPVWHIDAICSFLIVSWHWKSIDE